MCSWRQTRLALGQGVIGCHKCSLTVARLATCRRPQQGSRRKKSAVVAPAGTKAALGPCATEPTFRRLRYPIDDMVGQAHARGLNTCLHDTHCGVGGPASHPAGLSLHRARQKAAPMHGASALSLASH